MTDEKSTLNYELPKELYDQIKAEAERLSIPLAGFMRMLAVQYFERKGGSDGTTQNPGIGPDRENVHTQ